MNKRLLILVPILLIVLANQVDSQNGHVEIIQDDRTDRPPTQRESVPPEEPETPEPKLQTGQPTGPEETSGPTTEPPPNPKPEPQPVTKFICDSLKKADSLKAIVRAFRDEEYFYLLSTHLAIRIKQFDVQDQAGTRNFGSEDQLVITEPESRTQENVEEMEGQKVFGYAHISGNGKNATNYPSINYEVHMRKSQDVVGSVYELKFKRDWGERGYKPAYREHYILNRYIQFYRPAANKWFKTQYFNQPRHSFIEFSNSWEGNEVQYLNVRICYYSAVKDPCYMMRQSMNHKFKFFLPLSQQNNFATIFFNIDDNNELHIQRSLFTMPSELRSTDLRFPPIPMDEFFSCHRNPISERELKGVWFDKKSKSFYLFINRFYRKISQVDLVQDDFKIPRNAAFDSLKFDDSLFPEFEIMSSRYVKTVGETSFLTTSVGFVFALNADGLAGRLQRVERNLVDRCPKQTLLVEGNVFCFGETEYYHMIEQDNLNSSAHPNVGRERVMHRIVEIFQNTGIQYGDNQRLKFIFNYHKNQFIFMTGSDLFLFNYEKFSMNTAAKRIFTKYSAEERVEIKTNCLLDPYRPNCEKNGLVTTTAKPTDPITTGTPYDIIRANLDIIIISFLVLLLVLILLTFIIVRTIQARKRPMVKYNLYVKGLDGLSRLGSSFASRIFKKKSGTDVTPEAAAGSPTVSPKKADKGKAKSVTDDSVSVVSSANLTVGSRKSAKSVNYSNPKSTTSPSKRNTPELDLEKKRKPPI